MRGGEVSGESTEGMLMRFFDKLSCIVTGYVECRDLGEVRVSCVTRSGQDRLAWARLFPLAAGWQIRP